MKPWLPLPTSRKTAMFYKTLRGRHGAAQTERQREKDKENTTAAKYAKAFCQLFYQNIGMRKEEVVSQSDVDALDQKLTRVQSKYARERLSMPVLSQDRVAVRAIEQAARASGQAETRVATHVLLPPMLKLLQDEMRCYLQTPGLDEDLREQLANLLDYVYAFSVISFDYIQHDSNRLTKPIALSFAKGMMADIFELLSSTSITSSSVQESHEKIWSFINRNTYKLSTYKGDARYVQSLRNLQTQFKTPPVLVISPVVDKGDQPKLYLDNPLHHFPTDFAKAKHTPRSLRQIATHYLLAQIIDESMGQYPQLSGDPMWTMLRQSLTINMDPITGERCHVPNPQGFYLQLQELYHECLAQIKAEDKVSPVLQQKQEVLSTLLDWYQDLSDMSVDKLDVMLNYVSNNLAKGDRKWIGGYQKFLEAGG